MITVKVLAGGRLCDTFVYYSYKENTGLTRVAHVSLLKKRTLAMVPKRFCPSKRLPTVSSTRLSLQRPTLGAIVARNRWFTIVFEFKNNNATAGRHPAPATKTEQPFSPDFSHNLASSGGTFRSRPTRRRIRSTIMPFWPVRILKPINIILQVSKRFFAG